MGGKERWWGNYGIQNNGRPDPNLPPKDFGFIANPDLELIEDPEIKKQIIEDLKQTHPSGASIKDLPIEKLNLSLGNRFGCEAKRS